MWTSVPHTPARRTRMRTSSARMVGFGTSMSSMPGPAVRFTRARTERPAPRRRKTARQVDRRGPKARMPWPGAPADELAGRRPARRRATPRGSQSAGSCDPEYDGGSARGRSARSGEDGGDRARSAVRVVMRVTAASPMWVCHAPCRRRPRSNAGRAAISPMKIAAYACRQSVHSHIEGAPGGTQNDVHRRRAPVCDAASVGS